MKRKWIPFVTAFMIAGLALVQLLDFSGFIEFVSWSLTGNMILAAYAAIIVTSIEVFSLPFLFGLRLRPWARATSAILLLTTPAPWFVMGIMTFPLFEASLLCSASGLFLLVGAIQSFKVLDGSKAVIIQRQS